MLGTGSTNGRSLSRVEPLGELATFFRSKTCAHRSGARESELGPRAFERLFFFGEESDEPVWAQRRLSTSAIRTTSGHVLGRLTSQGRDRNPFPLHARPFYPVRRPMKESDEGRAVRAPVFDPPQRRFGLAVCAAKFCRRRCESRAATRGSVGSQGSKDRVKDVAPPRLPFEHSSSLVPRHARFWRTEHPVRPTLGSSSSLLPAKVATCRTIQSAFPRFAGDDLGLSPGISLLLRSRGSRKSVARCAGDGFPQAGSCAELQAIASN